MYLRILVTIFRVDACTFVAFGCEPLSKQGRVSVSNAERSKIPVVLSTFLFHLVTLNLADPHCPKPSQRRERTQEANLEGNMGALHRWLAHH